MFFFNDTATTEIYTLSLHDALPIFDHVPQLADISGPGIGQQPAHRRFAEARPAFPAQLERHSAREMVGEDRDVAVAVAERDRKSTRLNSSHANISYAVFCLQKKQRL